jgi:hypothetical protein
MYTSETETGKSKDALTAFSSLPGQILSVTYNQKGLGFEEMYD